MFELFKKKKYYQKSNDQLRHFQTHNNMENKNKVASRIIRFLDHNGDIRLGQVDGLVSSDLQNQSVDVIEGNDILKSSLRLSGEKATIQKLLTPFVPSQIIGIGLNYRKHAEETNMPIPQHPVVFSKNISSIQHPNQPIIVPRIACDPAEVDYECELAVVIKKDCKDVDEAHALDYVLGYTAANDVSSRRWQGAKSGNQWCRSKGFDTFCPFGPMLVTPSIIHDPQQLEISTVLNGKCMQKSNTKDMIFSVAQLISRLSQDTTLPKGTLILTGTPEGVGFTRKPPVYLKPGDAVTVSLQHIGKLTNTVISKP